MVFSGLPGYGEFYPHELSHLILGWLLPNLGAPVILDEALAVWLGGSKGKSWPALLRELAVALWRDPTLTPELLMRRPVTDPLRATTAAALLATAHEHGGMTSLRQALSPPRTEKGHDIVEGVARSMSMSPEQAKALWRRFVLSTP